MLEIPDSQSYSRPAKSTAGGRRHSARYQIGDEVAPRGSLSHSLSLSWIAEQATPQIMPKASKHTIIAKDESRGSLLERITISQPHKFDHVARRRKVKKPQYTAVVVPPSDPDTLKEYEEEMATKRLVHELLKESRRLAKIIDKKELDKKFPTPSLAERMELPEFKPTPPSVRFHKKSALLRVTEMSPMVQSILDRLRSAYEKFEQFSGHETEYIEQAEGLIERLEEIFMDFIGHADRMTAKQWRRLRNDCKGVGKISFNDLDTRINSVVSELAALYRQGWFMYNDRK